MAARNGSNSIARRRSGGVFDERQLEVRVGAGVAVPGEMLAARGKAGALKRADDHTSEPRDILGAFGERAIADDRVLRVRVDVEDRRIVEGDADGEELVGQRLGKPLGERFGLPAGAPQRRHRRPLRERILQTGDAPALLVDADPRRRGPAERLALGRELGHLFRRLDVAAEQDHAAEVELARQRSQLHGDARARHAADQKLSNVASRRQRHAAPRIIIASCVSRRLLLHELIWPAAPSTSGRSISFIPARRR